MLLKILLLIIVKEVTQTIYWICRGFWQDNRKMHKWILAGCSSILTLIAYVIFWKCGFKYPIVWTVLASCMWSTLSDLIMSEEKEVASFVGMSGLVILVSILMQKKNNQKSDKNFEKDKLSEG